jgi:hypothetical protein
VKVGSASRELKASVPRETGLEDEALREPECLAVLHSGKRGRGRFVGDARVVAVRSAVGTLKWPGSGASLPSLVPLFPPSAKRSYGSRRLTLPAPTTCLLG